MSADLFARLFLPFPADRVSWRVGSTNKDKTKGMALAFIDARDVMERLDEVMGPANWQCSYPHANGKTVCRIDLRIDGEWVGKEDGAGDTDVEAEKGALSDAFKRAAVRWGVGRYLYDLASPWVAIEPMGRSYKIAESELSKLRSLLVRDAKQHQPPVQPDQRDGEKAPSQADATPFDDEPETQTDARNRLMKEWRVHISKFTSTRELSLWWNGDARKKATKDFDLVQEDIEELKEAIIARKAEIERRAAA